MAAPIESTDGSSVSRVQSILEEISVREPTRRTYRGALKSFVAFADRGNLASVEADEEHEAATAHTYNRYLSTRRRSENDSWPVTFHKPARGGMGNKHLPDRA